MGKFDTERTQERTVWHGHGQCEVYGCPLGGSFYSSNWNCRYHQRQPAHKLGRITMLIKNHRPEIDWYESVLNQTVVDFDLKDTHMKAPQTMQVLENETLPEYKSRMKKYIEELLGLNQSLFIGGSEDQPGEHPREAFKRIRAHIDRKSLAAGEKDE